MLCRLLFLLIFLLQLAGPAESCQPPMPASSFQSNGIPMSVPSSPQYIPSNGIPLDQSAPIPPPPLPPAGNSDGSSGQLEMINAVDKGVKHRDITPYPGYIPPPPESAFPTLIENADLSQSRANQQSSNTFRSESPLQILTSETRRDLSCPAELTSITDFLTCIRRLSTVSLDEHNMLCDFEKDSGCRFKSISSPLSVGNFPNTDHYRTFAALAGRPEDEAPSGNFVFFIEHRGTDPEDEFIMSTPITCQEGNGVLKFDYWIVGQQDKVMLRVCTQNHLSRSCTQSISYYGPSSSIAIEVVHPNSTFFELEIVASNLVDPAVIVYDNIEYKAALCEREESVETTRAADVANEQTADSVDSFFEAEQREAERDPSGEEKDRRVVGEVIDGAVLTNPIPSRPIRLSPRREEVEQLVSDLTEQLGSEALEDAKDREEPQTVCKLLNCDFDRSMCFYGNYANESMSLSAWQLGNHKVGNPHTGVKEGSGFLFVGTDSPADSKIVNYILESPDLSVEEDFHLAMDIYRRSNDITLQICLDTPFYCPYTITSLGKDSKWTEGEMFLVPKGTLKVYIRAIQWRRFNWLAIDNLKVISPKC